MQSNTKYTTVCWLLCFQWQTLQLTYDVPNNEFLKKKTLSYCAERWRAFKTQLARQYLHGQDRSGHPQPSPCSKYQFIDEAAWEQFVRNRTTPVAMVSVSFCMWLQKTYQSIICIDFKYFMSCRKKEQKRLNTPSRMIAPTQCLEGVMRRQKESCWGPRGRG